MKKIWNIVLLAAITVVGLTPLAQAQTGGYGTYYDSSGYYGSNSYTQTQSYTYPYTYPSYPYYQPTYASYTPSISLSQTSLNLAIGQATSVTVYGGSAFSVSSSNPYSVSQTLYGNTLHVQALSPGSATITVCSGFSHYNYSGGCANLFVYVSGGYQYNPPYYGGYPYPHEGGSLFDVSTIRLEEGERERIEINTSSRYDDPYISDNSNRRVASASIEDDELMVRGLREGTTEITVCQSGRCDSVRITVRD